MFISVIFCLLVRDSERHREMQSHFKTSKDALAVCMARGCELESARLVEHATLVLVEVKPKGVQSQSERITSCGHGSALPKQIQCCTCP